MRARPHFNPYNVREPSELPDWKIVFKNNQPLDLEIGFSTARWLLSYAARFPQRNIVGLEIRKIYLPHAREKIEKAGLTNAYVLQANANTALEKLFPAQKLGKVFILFPDPWYKKKHLKRRVLTPEFLSILAQKMEPGGELHLATDQKFLADDMREVLAGSSFRPLHVTPYAEKNIEAVFTDIELYHLKNHNPLYRLVYQNG